ncbi:hypothetical protein [Dyella humicola]|uniref:hypothetical protein n=1 Tax=Dyella humicola TaxID=2992126 RepID=UPI0022591147|nr:hypothetical protein [Dyella humicola]
MMVIALRWCRRMTHAATHGRKDTMPALTNSVKFPHTFHRGTLRHAIRAEIAPSALLALSGADVSEAAFRTASPFFT